MKVIILNFLKPLGLTYFVFPMKVFHESYIHKKVNSTKFERNCSLEYYHMT